jgi:hypothetical protein
MYETYPVPPSLSKYFYTRENLPDTEMYSSDFRPVPVVDRGIEGKMGRYLRMVVLDFHALRVDAFFHLGIGSCRLLVKNGEATVLPISHSDSWTRTELEFGKTLRVPGPAWFEVTDIGDGALLVEVTVAAGGSIRYELNCGLVSVPPRRTLWSHEAYLKRVKEFGQLQRLALDGLKGVPFDRATPIQRLAVGSYPAFRCFNGNYSRTDINMIDDDGNRGVHQCRTCADTPIERRRYASLLLNVVRLRVFSMAEESRFMFAYLCG